MGLEHRRRRPSRRSESKVASYRYIAADRGILSIFSRIISQFDACFGTYSDRLWATLKSPIMTVNGRLNVCQETIKRRGLSSQQEFIQP